LIKLHGSLTSPFVRHCRIALIEQNMAFEFVPTDYAGSAAQTPTARVPFLHCNDGVFSDSSSILHWIRLQGHRLFLSSPKGTELYCLANTVLDTAINLFLLEKDGLTPENVPYLKRQADRVSSSLASLNEQPLKLKGTPNDAEWRVACALDWGRYRNRFDIKSLPNLQRFMKEIANFDAFTKTAPPPA